MNMNLTQDDLNAIRDLIVVTVKPIVKEAIEVAIDELSISIAAAFAEVYEKFDAQDRWLREHNSQLAYHGQQIDHIRGQLHAA